jgi:tRNA nucleotidyltransferase (CCA-adding enzyme)
MEGDPGLMFPVLSQSGLLAKLLPELKLEFEHGRPVNDAARILVRSLQCAAGERLGLAPRFALVVSRAGSAEAARAVSERLKAPGDCRDLALLAERHTGTIERAAALSAPELLELLERCDAFRRPDRFGDLLALTECLQHGERGWGETPYAPRVLLRRTLGAAAAVDAGKIAARSAKDEIAGRLRRARIAAIEKLV